MEMRKRDGREKNGDTTVLELGVEEGITEREIDRNPTEKNWPLVL